MAPNGRIEDIEERLSKMEQSYEQLSESIKDLLRVVQGDKFTGAKGLIDIMVTYGTNQTKNEEKIKGIRQLIIGIGIGVAVAAAIFGFVSWGDLLKIIK